MMIELQAGTLFTTQVMGYRVHAIGNSFSQIQSQITLWWLLVMSIGLLVSIKWKGNSMCVCD